MSIPRRMEAQEYMAAMGGPILFCYPKEGFDFVGYDIDNALAPASDCCYRCHLMGGACRAYSWSNFNGGTCWFKSQRGPVIYKAGDQSTLLFYSGQQTCAIQSGVDYVDNDIARVYSATTGGCCDICKAYPGCRAFSYTNYLGGSCWLKSAKGAPVTNSNVQSAEVYPSPIVDRPIFCNNLQYGVDFFDNDIGSAPSPQGAVGCCEICKKWEKCRAFSFTQQNGGTCWLKSRTGTPVVNPNVISATVFPNPVSDCVIQNGVDYFDNDIDNAPSATAEGCCDICRGRGDCHAFSWTNQNGGTCWLKSAKGSVVPNANVKSAVVV